MNREVSTPELGKQARMKLGLQLPNFTFRDGPKKLRSALSETAVRAEDAGFETLWVMDHFFQIAHIGPPEMDMLEAYSTLGYLACCTSEIQLATMVTGVTYRHPGILVKTVSTLDVLSGGRAWLGIGAGWFEREHRGLGIPFPSTKERFERLEETLQIAAQMWSENNGPFYGKHYRLEETLCVPQPLRRPPILIGGMGEKKALCLVAKYADACNFFEFAGMESLKQKLEVLRTHCNEVGTSYDSLSKTVIGQTSLTNSQSADKLIKKLESLAKLGFDRAIYSIKDPEDTETLELFRKRVIPAAEAF